jgi:SAM-dependent methyltransferase
MATDMDREIKDYWNGAGAAKDFSAPFDLAAFSRLVPATAPVLEVGCGYGRLLDCLHRAGYPRLLGLDISPALLARGRAAHPGLPLALFDGREPPCRAQAFGAVLLVGVLTALPLDRDQDRLLAGIFDVLAPGGVLALGDFALLSDERNLERYARGLDRPAPHRPELAEPAPYGCFPLPGGGLARHHAPERVRAVTAPYLPLSFRQGPCRTMNGNPALGFFFLGRKPG